MADTRDTTRPVPPCLVTGARAHPRLAPGLPTVRIAAIISHPIQYYAPIFRELAKRVDLHVFYAQTLSPAQQAEGFGRAFEWDIDLLSGYSHSFLSNVSKRPGPDHFLGGDTPDIGARLAGGEFDGLLVVGWYLKSFVQATWAAKRLGMPVVVRGDSQIGTPRSVLTRTAKALAYPALLRVFDAALYVGERSRAYFEYYHYPSDRLFFSPHCVDTEWFAERATPESGRALRARLGIGATEKAILFAGKLAPFKRPLDIVEACAGDRLRGTHVIVAGSGELEAQMRQRADALGVPLHLLGFQNQTEMPAAYSAADVLVLPSNGRETWGLVANEALASGTPIVVSEAAGCAPDLAADHVAGRISPLGDIPTLAWVIEEILATPPSAQTVRAKSTVYGLSSAINGLESSFETILRSKRKHSL
jgi:glycosyltransferase involved in cell wall biosynthesis